MPRKPVVSRTMKVTEFTVHYRMSGRNKVMTIVERVPRWYIDKDSLVRRVLLNWSTVGYEIVDITDIRLGTAHCTMTEQEYLDACTITDFEEINTVKI